MNSDLILWGLPGYIAYFIFQLSKPVRNRSGWDFVAQVALFSVICILLSNLSFSLFREIISKNCFLTLNSIWDNYFFDGKFKIILGAFYGVLLGVFTGRIWSRIWFQKGLSGFAKLLGGKDRDFEFSDTFFATCHSLMGKPVLLSLKTRKVYVGILFAATQDPNEVQRFIKITPIMSGNRDAGDLNVTFDTSYIFDFINEKEKNTPPKSRDILFPVSEISSLSGFDEELHKYFLEKGITKINWNKRV